MDGVCKVVTKNRDVLAVDSLSFGSINSQESEIQSTLGGFYQSTNIGRFNVGSVSLVFVNSIFHKTNSGQLESYKNRLPAFLFYHKEYFNVAVNHVHIAQLLMSQLDDWRNKNDKPALWFHLRNSILFVLFSTPKGGSSITSFEVRKTLDIHYYILFNIQTLQPLMTGLEQIIISGELLNMDKIHNFFTENVPEKELTTYWQWAGLPGRPQPAFSQYLPEVNI